MSSMLVDATPFYMPNDAMEAWLKALYDLACSSSVSQRVLTLHLFQNDLVPDCATVLGDLTEADFTGYAEIELLNDEDPQTCVGKLQGPHTLPDETFAIYVDEQVFTASGTANPNTIYGAYITDDDGLLIAVKRFAEPGPVGLATGDVVKVAGMMQLACNVPLPEDLP